MQEFPNCHRLLYIFMHSQEQRAFDIPASAKTRSMFAICICPSQTCLKLSFARLPISCHGLVFSRHKFIWLHIPKWQGNCVLQYKQMKDKNILSEDAQTVLALQAGVLYSSHSLHQVRLPQSCMQGLHLLQCIFNALMGVERNQFQGTRLPSRAIRQQNLSTTQQIQVSMLIGAAVQLTQALVGPAENAYLTLVMNH